MRSPALCVLLLAASAVVASTAVAGGALSVRGAGMGVAVTATASGLEAVGINPAGLAAGRQRNIVTVGLVPFAGRIGSDFLSYGLYTDYFTGVDTDSGRVSRYLSEADKSRILSAFDGGEGSLTTDAAASPVGVAVQIEGIGVAAFTIAERLAGHAVIPKEYVEFLFYGNTPGSAYDFRGSRLHIAWTRDYALSFGMPLPEPAFLQSLCAGATLKLVHGYGYADIVKFNTSLATSADGVLDGQVDVFARSAATDALRGAGPYSMFPAPAGTGYGIDLGVFGALTPAVSAGLSVTDIGSIRWTRNQREYVSLGSIRLEDPLLESQRDSLKDIVNGQTRDGDPFTTPLPATLHLGVAVRVDRLPFVAGAIGGDLLVACDYHQGLVEAAGTSTSPRLSLGVEYRPVEFLPLRTGFTLGGEESFLFALGFGVDLGAVQIDCAAQDVTWVVSPRSATTGAFALGFTVRI